jgi:hypothetical protein
VQMFSCGIDRLNLQNARLAESSVPCVAGIVRHRAKTARLSIVVSLLIAIAGSRWPERSNSTPSPSSRLAPAELPSTQEREHDADHQYDNR